MALSSTTTDHDEIKQWIEARGGRPVVVASTHDAEGDGLIRVEFGKDNDRLEDVPWDEFFEIFEKNNLAFLHQDQTAAGEESRFFRFLQREGTDQGDDGHESKTGQGTGSTKVDGKTSKTKSAARKKAPAKADDKPKRAAAKKSEGAAAKQGADDKPKRAAAKKADKADVANDKAKAKDKPKAKDEAKPKRAAKKADTGKAEAKGSDKAAKPKKDADAKAEKKAAKKAEKAPAKRSKKGE